MMPMRAGRKEKKHPIMAKGILHRGGRRICKNFFSFLIASPITIGAPERDLERSTQNLGECHQVTLSFSTLKVRLAKRINLIIHFGLRAQNLLQSRRMNSTRSRYLLKLFN